MPGQEVTVLLLSSPEEPGAEIKELDYESFDKLMNNLQKVDIYFCGSVYDMFKINFHFYANQNV